MLAFCVWMIGLIGTLILSVGAVAYLAVTLADGRPCPLKIPAGMLCGYIAGAVFVWTLVPRNWALSFWTTLAATANAERYGHALEHDAEGIIIWILFGAVVGAVSGGLLAQGAGPRREHRKVMELSD